MSGRMDETGELKRLAAAVLELRAELLVTQAALAGALAELARGRPEPEAGLGDSVARLLGFADAAGKGLSGQPGVRPQAPTEAALRMAEWAEGLLTTKG